MNTLRPLTRRSVLAAAAGAATLPMMRVARGETAHRLTILHMNDFHSRHEPVDGASVTCRPDQQREACFGGAARLATALARARDEAESAGREVLLVDAGDQFQGSLFYTAWHGRAELDVMHALGTEAMAVGNHEFDNGPKVLARFASAARFPLVSANIDAGADPDLNGLIRPFVMLPRAGLKVAILGATVEETPTISSPGPTVRFSPAGPAIAAAAAEARDDGATLVVVLSHLGIGTDLTLAGAVPGVDVIVGGHSHTLLSDTEPGAAGPAHRVVRGPAGATVVVQAACFGRYFGRLDLDVAADGTVLAYGGDCRRVALDLPEDPKVAAIVAGYAAQLDGVRRKVVGRLPTVLDNAQCRVKACELGAFVAGAMLASVKGADIALMNAGGIRTSLPAGDVTVGDVLGMLPFGNTIATLRIRGRDLMAALDNGLGRIGKGGFPQLAGLEAGMAGADSRLRRPDGSTAPLDPDATYLVVTNNFLRNGGDGYAALKDRAIDPYDTGPLLSDVVAAALPGAG